MLESGGGDVAGREFGYPVRIRCGGAQPNVVLLAGLGRGLPLTEREVACVRAVGDRHDTRRPTLGERRRPNPRLDSQFVRGLDRLADLCRGHRTGDLYCILDDQRISAPGDAVHVPDVQIEGRRNERHIADEVTLEVTEVVQGDESVAAAQRDDLELDALEVTYWPSVATSFST